MRLWLSSALALVACTKEGLRDDVRPDEVPAPAIAPRAKARLCPADTQGRDVDLAMNKAVAIAAAGARACAILDDTTVMCWGNDAIEHVGLGEYAERAVPPERVRGLNKVVELALSEYSGCARRANGTIACWGTEPHVPIPLNVPRSKVLTSATMALGLGHACVAREGTIRCGGELVPFARFSSWTPIPGVVGVKKIATTTGYGCAITAGSNVTCWGDGHNKHFTPIRGVPARALAPATALALSPWDACALHPSGKVTCLRDDGRTLVAVNVDNLDDARKIAVDDRDGCAVRADGRVACWTGMSGTASAHDPAVAADVPGLHGATDVAMGNGFVCVLRANGHVRCWGQNDQRELGFETLMTSNVALETCGIDQVSQVAVGADHACALRDNGDVYCWGENHDGMLGSGTQHSAVPVRVSSARDIVQLVAYRQTTCTLDRAGRVTCWGRNPLWGSGREHTFVLPTMPVRSIAVGNNGLCAVTAAGEVTCNNVRVPGITGAVRLVNHKFPCAEISDARGRRVVCWDTYFNAPAPPDSPAPPVMGLLELVDCGDHGTCGFTSARQLVCRDSRAMPDSRACKAWDPARLDAIADDDRRHARLACEVGANGLVRCTGDNRFGQLGTGKMGMQLTPGP